MLDKTYRKGNRKGKEGKGKGRDRRGRQWAGWERGGEGKGIVIFLMEN